MTFSNIYEKNFTRFFSFVDPKLFNLKSAYKLKNEILSIKNKPYMDLNIEICGIYTTRNLIHVALNHMNSDNQLDPEMVIRIDMKNKTIEALELTLWTGQTTKVYYDLYHEENAKKDIVDLAAKKELNDFLTMWLTNINQQGFKLNYSVLEVLNK